MKDRSFLQMSNENSGPRRILVSLTTYSATLRSARWNRRSLESCTLLVLSPPRTLSLGNDSSAGALVAPSLPCSLRQRRFQHFLRPRRAPRDQPIIKCRVIQSQDRKSVV